MRNTIILVILCVLGLVSVSFTVAIQNSKVIDYGENIFDKKVCVTDINFVKSDVKCQPRFINSLVVGEDKQISISEFNDEHPVVDISQDGNPLVLYHTGEDFETSYITIQRSSDLGETWPDGLIWYWPPAAFNEALAINPDVGFMGDGVHAFGTNEFATEDPFLFMHDYVDINNPESWSLYYWDRTSTTTYILESALSTNGSNLAGGTIMDYDGDSGYFEDTLLIMWDTNGLDDLSMDGGVYWLNTDGDGNPLPYSHLSSDAGDKMFFVFQREESDGLSTIYTAYCLVDDTTEYSDWRQNKVAGGSNYNCSSPDISVSGKNAYVVYNSDVNGNQDVYVATSKGGGFWKRYPVAESVDDEMYPVVYANGDEATCMFIKNDNLYKTTTEDTGKTWSTPEKINDNENTVVGNFHYLDVHGKYGFWTDERNGDSDIFFEEVGTEAILVVDSITGGFGIEATISNVGNAPAENVPWSIDLSGGIILLGSSTEDVVTLDEGETITVKSAFVFGIGRVSIEVTVSDVKKSVSGFVFGPFILGVS